MIGEMIFLDDSFYYDFNQDEDEEVDIPNASIWCGILSIIICFCGCIGFLSILFGITAIVLALVSRKASNGVLCKKSKVGLTTGILGILFFIVIVTSSILLLRIHSSLSVGFSSNKIK